MGRSREQPLRLEEIGRDALVWALGLGLLRLHVVCFALGTTGLVLVNLYRSPSDAWSGDAVRLWAIVLACHAAALLAGWSTWRAVRPHRLPGSTPAAGSAAARVGGAPYRSIWSGQRASANGHLTAAPVASTERLGVAQPEVGSAAANGHAPAAAPPGLPVRGRFNPPISQPPVLRHGWHPPATSEATAKLRATAGGAVAAGRTGWRRLSRATQAGLASMTARLGGPDESGEATLYQPYRPSGTQAIAPEPAPGWPVQTPVALEVPPGWESVVSPPDLSTPAPTFGAAAASEAAATAEEFPGWASPPPRAADGIDVADRAAESDEAAPTPPIVPARAADEPPLPTETEWTWMEAAATAWLARREADESGEPDGAGPSAPPGRG